MIDFKENSLTAVPITLKDLRKPISEELSQFRSFFKGTLQTSVSSLDLILKYMVQRRGKELRPMLVFYTAKLLGRVNDASLVAASMVELLHSATLIHDDVVDEALVRRNAFTIHALWNNKTSVLLGDFLLSRGLLIALDHDQFRMLKILSKAVQRMSEAELRQMKAAKLLNMTEERYFNIISGKTASLISACAACGAVSQHSDEKTIAQMADLGEQIGLAFQIRDDLFDYDYSKSGKSTGNDVRERKITLPLLAALQNAPTSTSQRIRAVLKKKDKNEADVHTVIEFVIKHGGIEYAREKMNAHIEQALRILDPFSHSEFADSYRKLIHFFAQRNT